MINPLIKKQLEKLQLATLPEYDGIKHQYVFRKIVPKQVDEGKTYLLRVDLNLLSQDIMLYNINQGNLPKRDLILGNILQVKGQRIQIMGNYQPAGNGSWMGWLLLNQVEIIKEVE